MINSEQVVAHFDQGGLGLPNKDYYTKKIPQLQAFVTPIWVISQRYLCCSAIATAKQAAASVMKIENALAMASKTPVELETPSKLS
jgi:predicted metalloendopeptidase